MLDQDIQNLKELMQASNDFEYVKVTDLENMFDTFVDFRDNRVFDLNRTLYINVDPDRLPTFTIDVEMHWTTISYKIYGTTRLAWLLWKLNNIDASNIFISKKPGEVVKYLPKRLVDGLVEQLNDFNEP